VTPVAPVLPNTFGCHREIVFAENQPEYLPLPAAITGKGIVTTRWRLTWRERVELLLGEHLFVQVLTFNEPLQPIKLRIGERE
jgi:hypothetical protein